jgi:uncharacterized protein
MTAVSPLRWVREYIADGNHRKHQPISLTDFDAPLETKLLILQPTPFCNIACDYCYLPDRNSTARMSIATVRKAMERLCEDGLAGSDLSVVWHAGEPLAMPIRFYEEAIAAIQQVIGSRYVVTHSIQTNATLIDDAWCDLFKRHNIRVGVSVDGPADLHDAHRRGRNGKGTHERVMRGISALKRHGIGFHAIAVVTSDTFAQADRFYAFFAEQGVSELGCNFDETEGTHGSSSLVGKESAHQTFLAQLLDCMANDKRPGPPLREIGAALSLISRPLPTYRWQTNRWPVNEQTLPFRLISIAHNGDFGTFSPELLGQRSPLYDDFVLGNVHVTGFLATMQSRAFRELWGDIASGIAECERTCAHFAFCGGGAPANKFFENGSFSTGETLYCRTMMKRPFDLVLERLERDIAEERTK